MEHGKTGRRKRVDRPMREKSAESTVHAEKKVRGKSEKKTYSARLPRRRISILSAAGYSTGCATIS